MKVGDRVSTPDGDGIIVGHETNRLEDRYGVKLNNSKRFFNARWYFKNELTIIK